ncbi:hypothetical protein J0A67_09915 [Algoriphagus aestuariicola]|uniref:Lipoprotein n=1 Tax=Algoriphagus aestuariicola TaxID=1852016 RepID=A0ABS3BPE7_9BACT|nr:hypothetical protein [Algoriphagus aestuariicola]MBN7801178.1 hypothetical protein [Algoriphagus aestuariicola]
MRTSLKNLVKIFLLGVFVCVAVSGCGLLSHDKDDLKPSKSQVVMETEDPDEEDPGRDD